MKKLLIGVFLGFVLCAQAANASPYLVCDPSVQAVGGGYEVWENGKMIKQASNESDGSFKMDLKDIATGQHTVTARYYIGDATWGTVYSAYSAPFTFTRPVLAVGNITGLKLAP